PPDQSVEPAEESHDEPAAAGAAAVGGSETKRETPAMGSGKGQAAAPGEIFVFLCPNGHKLNGPPSLKGKPGQCPHCGAKFRIPDDEDLELPEEEEVPMGEVDEDEEPGQPSGSRSSFDFSQFMGGAAQDDAAVEAVVEEPPVAPPPPGPSGLGYIVGRLWEQRTEGTELEIFLNEGEILAPDEFSEVLSSSDYGVFAIQEGDGTFAVSVVPWSAVRRIGMRRMEDLPPQLFQ
ncbi:MAG TPA: hypothetical protein VFV87_12770, partial [Pirellulaceae bacterium]|nr:hypothetical protein [Pirellulaceae bacterium]